MSKRTTASGAGSGSRDDLKKLAVSGLLVGGFVVYTLAHGARECGGTAPTNPSPEAPASTAILDDNPRIKRPV